MLTLNRSLYLGIAQGGNGSLPKLALPFQKGRQGCLSKL